VPGDGCGSEVTVEPEPEQRDHASGQRVRLHRTLLPAVHTEADSGHANLSVGGHRISPSVDS
jgi:hypothetical protein